MIMLATGNKMDTEAATPLVNQIIISATLTRFDVTSSRYRKCNKIARSLSTATAAIVKKDAEQRKKAKK